jgi:hypothetical protein
MPKWLRAVVIVVWLALMGSLVMRTRSGFEADDGTASTRLREDLPASVDEEWYGIYRDKDKVGYASHRREPSDSGFRVHDRAFMKVALMGAPRLVRTELHAETDRRLVLRRFDFTMRSGAIEVRVEGAATEGAVELRMTSGDSEPRTMRLPLADVPVLPQTLHAVFGQQKLVTGAVHKYSLLDPMTGSPTVVRLTVGERETLQLPGGPRDAFRVLREARGAKFTVWVDPEGEVLREEGPLGLVLVRELRSVATTGTLSDSGLDLGSIAAIRPGKKLDAPRTSKRLVLDAAGFPADLVLAFPPRQTWDGTKLSIETEKNAELATYSLPADATFAADLAATPFLESDATTIRDQAEAIVGTERDAVRVARRLLSWTHREIAKVPSASWPSATEVLRTRQGDCNEHAVLFAALARAAGLPARIAAGVVYVNGEEGLPDAFYYHAWNEVWLGRWVAVDAVFDQLPADATHVKFVTGGPERHGDLLPLLGKVTLAIKGEG